VSYNRGYYLYRCQTAHDIHNLADVPNIAPLGTTYLILQTYIVLHHYSGLSVLVAVGAFAVLAAVRSSAAVSLLSKKNSSDIRS
jgi:hypothetical protein